MLPVARQPTGDDDDDFLDESDAALDAAASLAQSADADPTPAVATAVVAEDEAGLAVRRTATGPGTAEDQADPHSQAPTLADPEASQHTAHTEVDMTSSTPTPATAGRVAASGDGTAVVPRGRLSTGPGSVSSDRVSDLGEAATPGSVFLPAADSGGSVSSAEPTTVVPRGRLSTGPGSVSSAEPAAFVPRGRLSTGPGSVSSAEPSEVVPRGRLSTGPGSVSSAEPAAAVVPRGRLSTGPGSESSAEPAAFVPRGRLSTGPGSVSQGSGLTQCLESEGDGSVFSEDKGPDAVERIETGPTDADRAARIAGGTASLLGSPEPTQPNTVGGPLSPVANGHDMGSPTPTPASPTNGVNGVRPAETLSVDTINPVVAVQPQPSDTPLPAPIMRHAVISSQPRRSISDVGETAIQSWPDIALPLVDFESKYGTNVAEGLTAGEAAKRLRKQGPNTPPTMIHDTPQCSDVCLPCCCITYLGFRSAAVADKNAELVKAFATLVPTDVLVIRDGTEKRVPPRDLVPGDVVELAAGDKVVADARVVRASGAQALKYVDGLPWEQGLSAAPAAPTDNPWEAPNFLFFGNGILTGRVTAVVMTSAESGILKSARGALGGRGPVSNPTRKGLWICSQGVCCPCATICGVGPATTRRKLEEHGIKVAQRKLKALKQTSAIVFNCRPADIVEMQKVDTVNKHNRRRTFQGRSDRVERVDTPLSRRSVLETPAWAQYWEERMVSQKQNLMQAARRCHRWGIQLVVITEGGSEHTPELCGLLNKQGFRTPTLVGGESLPTSVVAWARLLDRDRSKRGALPCVVAADVLPADRARAVRALHALGETVCYVARDNEPPTYAGVDVGVVMASTSKEAKARADAEVLHTIQSHALGTVLAAIRMVGGMPIEDGAAEGMTLVPLQTLQTPDLLPDDAHVNGGAEADDADPDGDGAADAEGAADAAPRHRSIPMPTVQRAEADAVSPSTSPSRAEAQPLLEGAAGGGRVPTMVNNPAITTPSPDGSSAAGSSSEISFKRISAV
eukprot:m.49725 g.49725  ORF g.49725 m.49725 type:complete len:1022 (-) comp8975_c0_seq1:157-3222(-)